MPFAAPDWALERVWEVRPDVETPEKARFIVSVKPTASFFFGGRSACWHGMNKSHRLGIESWRQITDGHRTSGLIVAAYCRNPGIKGNVSCRRFLA